MSCLLFYSSFRNSGYVSKTIWDLLYLFIISFSLHYYAIIVEDFFVITMLLSVE